MSVIHRKIITAPNGRNKRRLISLFVSFLIVLFGIVPIYASVNNSTFNSLILNGVSYGPYRDGQNPHTGPYPSVEEIEEDMFFLKSLTSRIRTYGSTGCIEPIARIANEHGLKVSQGAWLDKNHINNTPEIESAIKIANQGLVESIIVGNEVLLRKDLSEAELINYIIQTKKNVSVPVTTGELWHIWENSLNLINAVDYILVHIYPYWDGIPIEEAANYVIEKYEQLRERLKEKVPEKKIVIGETGWPTSGETLGEAVPSQNNQRRFIEEFVNLAQQKNIEYYYFEVFDEEWKKEMEGEGSYNGTQSNSSNDRNTVGGSWGLYHSDGTLKQALVGLLPEYMGYTTRSIREVYVDGWLSGGYDIGVNSSGKLTGWLSDEDGFMKMAYPSDQNWGAVFITVGKPVEPPRPFKDFSNFSTICVDLKGKIGGESVEIGIKDNTDPDDGKETKILVTDLSKSWQTKTFKVSQFTTADVKRLYVVLEFVFDGPDEQTIYFKNVKYLKTSTTINCFLSNSSITHGSIIIVSGSILPARAASVALTYTNPDESKLVRILPTDMYGHFSDTFTPDMVGTWKVKASCGGKQYYSGGESLQKIFKVKEPKKKPNIPPTADANGPYFGLVDVPLSFDGSGSSDDGAITNYTWEFGDETVGYGIRLIHTYTLIGNYTVTLTVTDDGSKTNSDTTYALITGRPNLPPSKPSLDGSTTGYTNTEYNYTAVSTDPDSDNIRYFFNWDDGTNTTTSFLANGTTCNAIHKWLSAGIYIIKVYAEDENNATSGTTELTVLIDIHYIGNIGYLIDNNGDGTYDLFRSNATGNETIVEIQDDGKYLVDIDGNGIWDYTYDPKTDTLTQYGKGAIIEEVDNILYYALGILVLLVIILLVIVIRQKRKKKEEQEEKSKKEK